MSAIIFPTKLHGIIINKYEGYINKKWKKWIFEISRELGEENLKFLINVLYLKSKSDIVINDLRKISIGGRVQIIHMWNSNFYQEDDIVKAKNIVEKLFEIPEKTLRIEGLIKNMEKGKVLNIVEKLKNLEKDNRTII